MALSPNSTACLLQRLPVLLWSGVLPSTWTLYLLRQFAACLTSQAASGSLQSSSRPSLSSKWLLSTLA
eukprot:4396868-Amphidinium_carterae.1